MEPLQDVVAAALARLLAGAPLSPGKLDFAWRAVVGPAMARATRVTLDGRRTLRVEVAGAAWQSELERALPVVRARLEALLGSGAVAAIEIRPGGNG
jgi:hypothetical protein